MGDETTSGDDAVESANSEGTDSLETYTGTPDRASSGPWWQRWWVAAVAAALLLLVGIAAGWIIGAASADDQDEVDEANAALAAAEEAADEEMSAADAENAELQDQNAELESSVSTLEEDLTEADDTIAALQDDLAEADEATEKAEDEHDEAIAEAEELRERYDPEIRAEAQAGYDAEVARACDAAKADIDAPIESLVNWNEAWSLVASEQDLVNAVTACAAEERAKSAEQRELDRLAGCVPVDPDAIEKNPDAQAGTCFVMFARIVQFDANTGPCSFHANIAANDSDRSFDFDVRSTFGYDDSPLLSSLETDCPELNGIDGDDTVQVWAVGAGAFSYDTSIGGSNTIPAFRIEKVELIRKG